MLSTYKIQSNTTNKRSKNVSNTNNDNNSHREHEHKRSQKSSNDLKVSSKGDDKGVSRNLKSKIDLKGGDPDDVNGRDLIEEASSFN